MNSAGNQYYNTYAKKVERRGGLINQDNREWKRVCKWQKCFGYIG